MKYSDRHISDEELDQLFRDAHASEGPESLFVPEFWSEMESMLPAEKKTKRGLYWIPLAASAILGAVILFYPQNPALIDRLEQKQVVVYGQSERENENERVSEGQNGTRSLPGQKPDESSVIAENKTVQLIRLSETKTHKTKHKTDFKKRRQVYSYDPDQLADFQIQYLPPIPVDRADETPNEQTNVEADPKLDAESYTGLDSIRLKPRNERVIHEEIAILPKIVPHELNQWYVELGPTIGQSPYLTPGQKRNMVGGAVLGGGYTKRIDNAFVSMGLQARLEGFGGLNYQETNFSANIVRTVSVKQLYSLELPLKFGYIFKRSEFSFGVVPGIQLFIHGKERITENQVVQREESFTGKVEHSNSLTMEFGFQYYYNFSSELSIGAKVNADILRPFHTDYYLGKSAGLPVNGQLVLRKIISK